MVARGITLAEKSTEPDDGCPDVELHDCDNSVLSSASKALALLEVIAKAGSAAVGVSEIAVHLGMPKSTTHRLLKTLGEHGFIGRVGSKYRMGNRLFELGEAARWSEYGELRDVASESLAWLFERAGATVHLAVLTDRSILVLEKITTLSGSRLPTRVGGRLPATCTALGKAILAFSEPSALVKVLSAPLPRVTPYSIRSPQLLVDQLRVAHTTGFASEMEEVRLGAACVAAPVLVGGHVVAAVSVSRDTADAPSLEHGRLVREAAQRVSRLLPAC